MILEGPIATTVTIVSNSRNKNAKKKLYFCYICCWNIIGLAQLLKTSFPAAWLFGVMMKEQLREPPTPRYIHFLPVSILFNHHVSLTKNWSPTPSPSKPHIHYNPEKDEKFHQESRKNRTLKSKLMFVACHDLFFPPIIWLTGTTSTAISTNWAEKFGQVLKLKDQ